MNIGGNYCNKAGCMKIASHTMEDGMSLCSEHTKVRFYLMGLKSLEIE